MIQLPNLSPALNQLGQYLEGEFSNRSQALAQPIWYVHLHLWFRRVSLFSEDSITLFTEQASVVNFDQPYRPRLLRLKQGETGLIVQYYKLQDMEAFKGSGRSPEKLQSLSLKDIDALTHPGCFLQVETEQISPTSYQFKAFPTTDEPCCFSHQHQTYTIALGFEVNEKEYKAHDRGIDTQTGKIMWGGMGPYCFEKISTFS